MALALPLSRGARMTAAAVAASSFAIGLAACGSSSRSSTLTRTGALHHTTAARRASRRPATPVRLRYRALYSLPSATQDPAVASLGGDRYVLLGGLTAADTSTDAVLIGDGSGVRPEATLPNAQHDAQATRLGALVYLFGGGQFTEYSHVLAYDPLGATVALAGSLPRAESDVAVAGTGTTAYVVGGYDGASALDTIVAWSPGHGPQVVGRLPLALRYAAAAMVGQTLLIAGGTTGSGGASDAILRWDAGSGRVSEIGRLPAPLTHAGAAVLGGEMYLVGGRGSAPTSQSATVLAIDPATGRVRLAGRLPQPLSDAGVVAVDGGLVVAGGRGSAGTQSAVGELVPAG